jgi:ABC-type nitrate/sulfonate/bicarbonate transport system permease component
MREKRDLFVVVKEWHTIRLTNDKLAIDLNRGLLSHLESLVEGHESLKKTVGWILRFAYPEDVPLNRIIEAYVTPEGSAEIIRKTTFGSQRIRIPELSGDEARWLVEQVMSIKNRGAHPLIPKSVAKALRVELMKNEWIMAIFAVLIVWQGIVTLFNVPSDAIPSPSNVAAVMWVNGIEFGYAVLLSYRNLVLGILGAASVAVPAAFTSGLRGRIDFTLTPLVMLVYSLPDLALLPILVYYIGHGALAAVLMCSVCSFAPIYFTVRDGVRAIPTEQFEAVRMLGGNLASLLRELILPGAWPNILTGVRLAFSYCWQIILAIEMIAFVPGIGYYINESLMGATPRLDVAFAAMFAVGIVVLATDRLIFLKLEERIRRWRQ